MMDMSEARRVRRSWSDAQKREIVAASLEPGASVSVIARRYDVNTNLLFIWRQLYRDGLLAEPGAGGPSLLPITITGEQAEKWPAAGIVDTAIGCFMKPEVSYATTEVWA
jgi:transposase